jgi:hypothetical protein
MTRNKPRTRKGAPRERNFLRFTLPWSGGEGPSQPANHRHGKNTKENTARKELHKAAVGRRGVGARRRRARRNLAALLRCLRAVADLPQQKVSPPSPLPRRTGRLFDAGAGVHSAGAPRGRSQASNRGWSGAHSTGDASGMDRAPRTAAATAVVAHAAGCFIVSPRRNVRSLGRMRGAPLGTAQWVPSNRGQHGKCRSAVHER